MNELAAALTRAGTTIGERVISYLPNLFGALLLLFAGWLVARLLRALTIRALMLGETLLGKFGALDRGDRARSQRVAGVLGTIVFWGSLLVFATAATQVLELHFFTDWLTKLVGYLPVLAAGALIVAAGYLISRFVADLVLSTAGWIEAPQRALLARVMQVTIFAGSLLVGADQIGLEITFLALFFGAAAVFVGGGAAVAVGLGSRAHVANLIGAHQMRQAFAVGQRIRVAECEGRILEITATSVVLECADGRVTLPGRLYSEVPITVYGGDGDA